MSTLEDAIRIADRQQFRTGGSNARFRDEFIRKSLQNPGNFYRTYGTDLKAMDSGQVTTTQPMEQTPSLPSTQTVPSSSTDFNLTSGDISRGDGGGYSYGASPSSSPNSGIGSGGVLGSSVYGGQALGALAGVFGGGPLSGVAGQALSGTPQSLEAAAKSAAIGYGVNAMNVGKYGGLVGLGINSAISGKAPTPETIGVSLAMMHPVTAPLAAAYSLYGAIKGWQNDVAKQKSLEALYGNLNSTDLGFGGATDNAQGTGGGYGFGIGSTVGPYGPDADAIENNDQGTNATASTGEVGNNEGGVADGVW